MSKQNTLKDQQQSPAKIFVLDQHLNEQLKKKISFFAPKLIPKKRKSLVLKATPTQIIKNSEKIKFITLSRKQAQTFTDYRLKKNLVKNVSGQKLDIFRSTIRQTVLIKITPNNTIATITNNEGNIKRNISAGTIGIKSSKKNYKLVFNMVVTELLSVLRKSKQKKHILFRLEAPRILRKRLLRRLKFYHRSTNIFETARKLPFNGCRPPKVRRKKRKGLRIFKPHL